eukprot:11624053-Alexandrium_andersonii.AAC.1
MQSSTVALRKSALPSLSRFSKAVVMAASVMAGVPEESGQTVVGPAAHGEGWIFSRREARSSRE